VIVVEHPPGYPAERAHALEIVLGAILGVGYEAREAPRGDVVLRPAGEEGAVRVADVLFATPPDAWLTDRALPREPLTRDGELPLLYAVTDEPALASGETWLGLDVFGSAFFMATRYEELVRAERDQHERFPSAAATAVRAGFATRPILHDYAEQLWSRLQASWPRLTRPQPTARLLPSHDVDWPAMPARPLAAVLRTVAGDVVLRRDPRLARDRAGWELARRRGRLQRDPFDTFDELMDLSEAVATRSAFYFLADGTYALDDVAPLLRRVHERGHEIGLHPGYDSFRRPDAIATQLQALQQACARLGIEQETWGGRMHYLQWENPTTWQALEDAGLDYDTTIGYAEHGGFRSGLCVEHPVFNLRSRTQLRLRERPLVAMDGALLGHHDAEQTLLALRGECARVGGDFTLLWHNSALLSRRERALLHRIMGS
jgi:hypothetical protein